MYYILPYIHAYTHLFYTLNYTLTCILYKHTLTLKLYTYMCYILYSGEYMLQYRKYRSIRSDQSRAKHMSTSDHYPYANEVGILYYIMLHMLVVSM